MPVPPGRRGRVGAGAEGPAQRVAGILGGAVAGVEEQADGSAGHLALGADEQGDPIEGVEPSTAEGFVVDQRHTPVDGVDPDAEGGGSVVVEAVDQTGKADGHPRDEAVEDGPRGRGVEIPDPCRSGR